MYIRDLLLHAPVCPMVSHPCSAFDEPQGVPRFPLLVTPRPKGSVFDPLNYVVERSA